MDPFEQAWKHLNRLDPRLMALVEKHLRRIPAVRRKIDADTAAMMAEVAPTLQPYKDRLETIAAIPDRGRSRDQVLEIMQDLQARESERWQDGYASGAVYHGDPDHIDFLSRVYSLHSQANPLHADLWPSITKFEAEIVAMTADMLGGRHSGSQVCGTLSSGGTESILLAMKTYRDRAREEKGIRRPEMVVPVTAHAAFDKAAAYFGIKMVKIPVDRDFRADVNAAARAITRRTVVMVGSAPTFPHGMVDPIERLSELARARGIGFHTDACLGGFILPWAKELGYNVPPFDFRLPGVTSMSADTHKYGYAAKGTSVVLYRTPALRRYQYFTIADWPGGLYFSPSFAGSRPGALSAACWAAMVSIGRDGYRDATRKILETADMIKAGISGIPGLEVLGNPLWVIAFASRRLDIYRVMDVMSERGWSLNGLHRPSCVHLCVTLRHTRPGVAQRFIDDLEAAVEDVKRSPCAEGGMAPVYGLAANLPLRGVVGDILKAYVDALYRL
ncbi:MAG: aminotransferase class V-fold PLP-dependent enzyme [Desulfobacterales bacterium]|nr:aminotransferase class V-fold PLP-dependent enzyme [Desulfobacterales bacterium]